MSPWIKALIATAITCLLVVSFAVTYSLLHREQPRTLASVATPSPTPTSTPTSTPSPAATPDSSPTPNELYPRAPQEAESHTPEYTWMRKGNMGVVLNTLETRLLRVSSSPDSRIKLEILSDSGVNFGLASADASVPQGFVPGSFTCGVNKVTRTALECNVPSNPVVVLIDDRRAGTALSALLSRGRNADKVSAQNRVSITLYEWQCVNWCQ